MKKKSLLFIAFVFTFTLFKAQDEENSKPQRSSKSKTIVIQDTDVETDSEVDNQPEVEYKNLLKFEVLDLLKGYAAFSYCRSLKKEVSVYGTYARIYAPNLIRQVFDAGSMFEAGIIYDDNLIIPNLIYLSQDYFSYEPGNLYRVGLKYFFDNELANEGSYLGLEYGSMSYSYSIFTNNFSTPFAKTSTTDYRFFFGTQGAFGDSKLFYDINVATGFGQRKHNYYYYQKSPTTSNDNNYSNPILAEGRKHTVIRFSFCFAIGYAF